MATRAVAILDRRPEAPEATAEARRSNLRLVDGGAADPAPARPPAPAEAFDPDLPAGLYGAMFGLFGGFLAVMFASFSGADAMGVVGAICAITLVGYFGVPLAMHRAAPRAQAPRPRSIDRLLADGIAAGDGHRTRGREAIGLVLLIPAIIFLWGVAVSLIRALLL